jgi:hypothetical protein
MVPEAAVSNPPRSSRRCSSPSTVDSAARRACYEQPGPALPGGRAAVRVRGPNLGEYADSLVAKAQVRATLATISDDAYNEYLDLRSLEETREEVAGTPSPKSRDWLTDDDESAGPGRKRRAVTLPAGGRGKSSQGACGPRPRPALKAQVSAATSRYVAL